MASMTVSLKRKGLLSCQGSRRRTLPKRAVPPRQVSPLPPQAHHDEETKDKSSLHSSSTTTNDKSLQDDSRSLSSNDSVNTKHSKHDAHIKERQHARCTSACRSVSSMETQASAPRRRRRFKQTSKWNFRVGQHADERSHGHNNTAAARWSMADFDVVDEIGRGGFSTVSLAFDSKGDKYVALKQVTMQDIKNKGSVKDLRNEVEIQTSLNHEHILQSFGYFLSKDCIILVLEYAPGGNLFEIMHDSDDDKLSLNVAQTFVRQVTSALAYLESQHVAHRDIKSENIVVTDESTAKLIDFGYAVYAPPSNDVRTTFCGTPECMPPEMLTRNGKGGYVAGYVDPWALGVLAYELVVGRSPFYLTRSEKRRIASEKGYPEAYLVTLDRIRMYTSLELPPDCDEAFFDFCSSLIKVKPHCRMSATEALQHEWLCTVGTTWEQSCRGRENSPGRHVAKRAKVVAV